MPPRNLFAVLTASVFLVALVAACGGGDDDDGGTTDRGQLSDQANVPTSTPWQNPPEILIIDPNNIQPLPPNEPNTGGDDDDDGEPVAGEPGVCGETYTVEAGDTTFAIGEKCGWPVDDLENFVIALEELNPDIDVRALSIDQVLTMPEIPVEEETSEEEQ